MDDHVGRWAGADAVDPAEALQQCLQRGCCGEQGVEVDLEADLDDLGGDQQARFTGVLGVWCDGAEPGGDLLLDSGAVRSAET
ncbi:hypothetical protein U9R90_18875 [Streptomyces sp. E11-3]